MIKKVNINILQFFLQILSSHLNILYVDNLIINACARHKISWSIFGLVLVRRL